jgi:hypothetical protein
MKRFLFFLLSLSIKDLCSAMMPCQAMVLTAYFCFGPHGGKSFCNNIWYKIQEQQDSYYRQYS